MTEFPERWARASIGEAATLINGRAFKPTDWGSSGLPIIRIQNLNRPDAAYNFFDGPLDPRHEVKPGELLFAWSGTPGTSFGAHIWSGPRAALNQHIFRVLHSEDLLDRKFFREAINDQLDELIRRAHGGAGLAHVTKDKFESIEIPVPSLTEQRRIVAKLEELFSELEAGVAALRRAQRRLTRYRQALLQAAVTGELTWEWREQQTHDIQLGKLNGFPAGWVCHQFGSLISRIEAGKNFTARGVPPADGETGIVKISAVTWNIYDENESKTVPREDLIVPRLFIRPGDFLFSRANTLELVGACVIVHRVSKPIMLSDKILRVHFKDESLKPWVLTFLRSRNGRRELEARASGNQLSMRNISQAKLNTLPIPTPPAEERTVILTELDRRLSAVDAVESTLQTSLRRAECLRQSILERAFRGELVPQDPNDEPAEALLARLKTTASDTPAPRRRGRPPKAEPAEPQAPRRRGRPRKAAALASGGSV